MANIDVFYDQFGSSYGVEFNFTNNAFSVDFVSNDGYPQQETVRVVDRGHAAGYHIMDMCYQGYNYSFYVALSYPFATYTRVYDLTACPYTPPVNPCDLVINNIIVTNETSTGANDGTLVVTASTTYGGLQYSLDNTVFQSSNSFGSLAPGNYTIFVKDANGCAVSQNFVVLSFANPVQNYSTNLPIVTLPSGNISRWQAAFNPIVINYQRKDFVVSAIEQGVDQTQIKATLSSVLTLEQAQLATNDKIYLSTLLYDYYGNAASVATVGGVSVLTINTTYVGDDSDGFINIPNSKKGYAVQTKITYGTDAVDPSSIVAEHTPNQKGATSADISGFLRNVLSPNDNYNYSDASWVDTNLGQSYTFLYREIWDDVVGQWYSAPYPLYFNYAAAQLGDKYGGNRAEYVTFAGIDRAKFLSGFTKPTYFQGLPFEIQFIYSENVINEQLVLELIPDCGTTVNSFLLNADAGYLLNANSGRFIINRVYNPAISGYNVIKALGVTRLLIPDVFDCCATKITANIYYMNGATRVYVMQDLIVKNVCPCDDPYVYLKWINKNGGWDYYRFGFNQFANANVSNDETVTKYVADWANDQTIEDVIKKSSIRQLTIGADLLDENDSDGLQWLLKSRRVQMLFSTSPVKWQTVIAKPGNTPTNQTRKRNSNFSATIYLPSDNIQQG